MEPIIVGVIVMAIGGLQAIRPDLFIRFQIWIQRVVMGVDYKPSKRTYTITRFIGVFLMLVGLLAITGVLK